jgi:hypothetical protein
MLFLKAVFFVGGIEEVKKLLDSYLRRVTPGGVFAKARRLDGWRGGSHSNSNTVE